MEEAGGYDSAVVSSLFRLDNGPLKYRLESPRCLDGTTAPRIKFSTNGSYLPRWSQSVDSPRISRTLVGGVERYESFSGGFVAVDVTVETKYRARRAGD